MQLKPIDTIKKAFQSSEQPAAERRPHRLGVALSGGGVRGFAHIGVLYAMDELGIKPDIIAGVSAGSVAGSLYCAGVKPLDIMKAFMTSKFTDFCELQVPTKGFLNMNGFCKFLQTNLPVTKIEECPTPLVVCATNLDEATPVQWRQGSIAERVCASCSIPIVFAPARISGVNYVDGGVLHNLPAWAIRQECDHLIGVNVSPLLRVRSRIGSVIEIAQRSYHMMARANIAQDLAMCDTIISADAIAELKVFNLKEKENAFRSGYRAAKQALLASDLLDSPAVK